MSRHILFKEKRLTNKQFNIALDSIKYARKREISSILVCINLIDSALSMFALDFALLRVHMYENYSNSHIKNDNYKLAHEALFNMSNQDIYFIALECLLYKKNTDKRKSIFCSEAFKKASAAVEYYYMYKNRHETFLTLLYTYLKRVLSIEYDSVELNLGTLQLRNRYIDFNQDEYDEINAVNTRVIDENIFIDTSDDAGARRRRQQEQERQEQQSCESDK